LLGCISPHEYHLSFLCDNLSLKRAQRINHRFGLIVYLDNSCGFLRVPQGLFSLSQFVAGALDFLLEEQTPLPGFSNSERFSEFLKLLNIRISKSGGACWIAVSHRDRDHAFFAGSNLCRTVQSSLGVYPALRLINAHQGEAVN